MIFLFGRHTFCWAVFGSVSLAASGARAEEGSDEFGLPESLTETQFDALREHPPFTRVLDFSETIRLTGVATINGEQVATVRDRTKDKSYVISGKPNDDGWKMVKVESTNELDKLTATISVAGGEEITLQFDGKQLNPEPKKGIAAIRASAANARKPPPTDEEKQKFGEWVRGRMSKMSDAQKKRVGQIMHEKMKANPKLTDRQKGEIFVKILDHVESEKR